MYKIYNIVNCGYKVGRQYDSLWGNTGWAANRKGKHLYEQFLNYYNIHRMERAFFSQSVSLTQYVVLSAHLSVCPFQLAS